jgi:hypothetical protein
MFLSHPPWPRHAKMRPFLSFVVGSKRSSAYPCDRAGLGRPRDGWVVYRYASDCFLPAALLGKGRVLARPECKGIVHDVFESPKEPVLISL